MRISRSGDYIAQIRLIGGRVFEKLLAESGADTFNSSSSKGSESLWVGHVLSKLTKPLPHPRLDPALCLEELLKPVTCLLPKMMTLSPW